MSLLIDNPALDEIRRHLESAYPEEAAGFLLGRVDGEHRRVTAVLAAGNAREGESRRNRYLITPQEMAQAEDQAEANGLDVLGVYHSHPDVPNRPSEFDREWALPWYSYAIGRVDAGRLVSTRAWRLRDDRSGFDEETVEVVASHLEAPERQIPPHNSSTMP